MVNGRGVKSRRVGILHIDLWETYEYSASLYTQESCALASGALWERGHIDLRAHTLRVHDQTSFSHNGPKTEVPHITW